MEASTDHRRRDTSRLAARYYLSRTDGTGYTVYASSDHCARAIMSDLVREGADRLHSRCS